MRRLNRTLLVITSICVLGMAGCATEDEEGKLFIDDARAAGFAEDRQQRFDLIDAEDGWSGHWAGDRVELYQYKHSDRIKLDFFKAVIDIGEEENHGWKEYCQQKNLIMLTKGQNACSRLATITAASRP